MADSTVRIVFLGDASQAIRQVRNLESGFSTLGRSAKIAAVAMGAAFIGALGAATKAAIDFDRAMRNVNSIAKLSEKQFQSLQKRVLDLSKTTGQAPKTLAEGLYDIVSSGFKANEGIKILAASAKAATAGLTDTATATKAVVAVLNAYHLSANDARKVSDVLFQEVNKGVNTFEELASQIGDVVPVASALKVPIQDVAGALATVTLHGVSAAEAATQVKQVMVSMLKPSTDLKKEFKDLGYESAQSALQQKGLVGVIQDLSGAAKGNQQTIASWFPNVRALSGFMNLAGQNIGQFTSNTKAMDIASRGAGATAAAFAEQGKSIAFQWQLAKASLTAAAIPIGQLLFPALVKGAQGVAYLANAITRAMPTIQRVVGETARFVGRVWQQYGQPAFEAIRTQAVRAAQAIETNWPAISRITREVANFIRTNVAPIIVSGFKLVEEVARQVVAAIRDNWPQIKTIVQAVAEIVKLQMLAMAAAIRILTPIVKALGPVFQVAFRAAAIVVSTEAKIILAVIHAVESAIHGLVSALNALRGAAGFIGGIAGKVAGAAGRAIPRRAGGGFIPSVPGSVPGKDSVLAMLAPGEIVLNRAQQNVLGGPQYLSQLFGFTGERGAGIPKFARGGRVQPHGRGGVPPVGGGYPHHSPKSRSYGKVTRAARAAFAAAEKVSGRISDLDRSYGQLVRQFSITNEQPFTYDANGNQIVDQAAIAQHLKEIGALITARQKMLALLAEEKKDLQEAIEALQKAIAELVKEMQKEKEAADAAAAEAKRLTQQLSEDEKQERIIRAQHPKTAAQRKAQSAALARIHADENMLRRQIGGAKRTEQAHLAQRRKLDTLRNDLSSNVPTARQMLHANPFDAHDVNLDIMALMQEAVDWEGYANTPNETGGGFGGGGGGGGGGGLPGTPDPLGALQAQIADLQARLGRANLALGLERVQLPVIGSFQRGTLHVPETGMALLHAGEQVIPAGVAGSGGGEGMTPILIQVSSDDRLLGELLKKAIRVEAVAASSDISMQIGREANRRNRAGTF